MKAKVKAFITRYGMIKRGDKVLCALSAGADSMAMVMLLKELSKEMGFEVAAAHFIHGIRPEEAEKEKNLAQNLCEELGIEFRFEEGDTLKYCKEHKLGTEDGARRLRYEFMKSTARGLKADKIATAHNKNDNAETVLLNLIRGSGMRGLSGIPPVRDNIIRPVMCLSRQEIEQYLGEREYAKDATNYTLDYTRNKIRHKLLPLVEEINDRGIDNISLAGLRLREENDFIESETEKTVGTCSFENGVISADIKQLKKLSPGLLKRVIHRLYEKAGGDMGKLCSVHIDSVADLVYNKLPPKYIVMPSGIRMRLKNKKLLIYNGECEDKIC